jgi:heptosyltransferase-2
MGAVLRATALLPMIKRKYPSSKVTWITDSPALLENNPYIDLVLANHETTLNYLPAFDFDIGLVIDKSLDASAILRKTQVDIVYGFVANGATGAIEPATPAAFELWDIGLNNEKKFFSNFKTELQLQAETLELDYSRDHYGIYLSEEEKNESTQRNILWSVFGKKTVIGLNTGCGPLLPEKKFPIAKWVEILSQFQKHESLLQKVSLVLLGGPAETAEHQALKTNFPFLNLSPLSQGLRDGLMSVGACDLIITGDSLGMHMGIGLKKYVVAWFGPSCAHEIDLYDRGEMLYATTLLCSPCWKRTCNQKSKCNDSMLAETILKALERGLDFLKQAPPLLDFERYQISHLQEKQMGDDYHTPHEFMNLMIEMLL